MAQRKGIVIIMKRGIVQIVLANLLSLIIGLVSNFILPVFLSVETYAEIKTFTFYLSYAGVFMLGYCDGMYLQYGGMQISTVKDSEIESDFGNLIIILSTASVIVFFAGIFRKDMVILLFAIGLFFYDILGMIRMLFQAVGEYGFYSKSLNSEKILILLSNLCLIFCLKSDKSYIYIGTQILVYVIVILFLAVSFFLKEKKISKFRIDFKRVQCFVSTGFVLMLGNMSAGVFTGIDRWFIKWLMDSKSFAYYSYAVSMETVIGLFMSPLSVVMYNYFCTKHNERDIKRVKQFMTVWGYILIAAAFPAKLIVEHFIPKYVESISVLFLLFLSQAVLFIVQGVYVNLYKAEKKQAFYLRQILYMIIISVITNAMFYLVLRKMNAFAIGTLVTSVIWLIACEIKYRQLSFNKNEWTGIIVISASFLLFSYKFNSIIGLLGYCIVGLIVLYFLWNETFYEIKEIVSNYISKLLRKD